MVGASPVSSLSGMAASAVQPSGAGRGRDEPGRVPGPIAPAVLGDGAALVDLQVEVGLIVPVEVEHDADPVDTPADRHRGFAFRPAERPGRPGAGIRRRRRGTRCRRRAGRSWCRSRPFRRWRRASTIGGGVLPAVVVELAVEERLGAESVLHGAIGLGGGPLRSVSHTSAAAAARQGSSPTLSLPARPAMKWRHHCRGDSESPRCRRAACRQNCTAGSFAVHGPEGRQPRLDRECALVPFAGPGLVADQRDLLPLGRLGEITAVGVNAGPAPGRRGVVRVAGLMDVGLGQHQELAQVPRGGGPRWSCGTRPASGKRRLRADASGSDPTMSRNASRARCHCPAWA